VAQPIEPIPKRLYSGAETRRLDRIVIDEHGIAGIVLMKNAGRAAFDALTASWPGADELTIVCGKGNNAGDGYIVAGLAANQGLAVQLLQLGPAAQLEGDAGLARDWALAQGVTVTEVDAQTPELELRGQVIVDALLGTGLAGPVRPGFALAIETLNADSRPVLAIDVPSGVCADTGRILGVAVEADVTVTFIGAKQGLFTGRAVDVRGRVIYADLEVPTSVMARERGVDVFDWPALRAAFGRRANSAYKNRFGHVLVLGGDLGMGGAVALAGEAALRCGAGLVSVVTREQHVGPLLARCPELMVLGAQHTAGVTDRLAMADVIAVGPGLGREAWGRELLDRALSMDKPCVVDADGLNLLAERDGALPSGSAITPHPGEAARLLGVSNDDVQADRFATVKRLAERYRTTALLKGAGTLVVAENSDACGICLLGNPAMATAGMGDVLTGVVAGLAARMPAAAAVPAAVCLHSAAADRVVAEQGERGLLASDILARLVPELNADLD
jgi:NAD(P)H-hydrate epimerase